MKQEFGSAIFNHDTRLFTVKTPKGVFENVHNSGGFDNYRDMDMCVGRSFNDLRQVGGLMAYLFDNPENEYLFYYPDHVGGGTITVYREN